MFISLSEYFDVSKDNVTNERCVVHKTLIDCNTEQECEETFVERLGKQKSLVKIALIGQYGILTKWQKMVCYIKIVLTN